MSTSMEGPQIDALHAIHRTPWIRFFPFPFLLSHSFAVGFLFSLFYMFFHILFVISLPSIPLYFEMKNCVTPLRRIRHHGNTLFLEKGRCGKGQRKVVTRANSKFNGQERGGNEGVALSLAKRKWKMKRLWAKQRSKERSMLMIRCGSDHWRWQRLMCVGVAFIAALSRYGSVSPSQSCPLSTSFSMPIFSSPSTFR